MRFPAEHPTITKQLYDCARHVSLATSVYVIGRFASVRVAHQFSSSLHVMGAAKWACHIFADRLAPNVKHGDLLPLYFYDQSSSTWYQPEVAILRPTNDVVFSAIDDDYNNNDLYTAYRYCWQAVDAVPAPHGAYAALGPSKLTDNGRKALYALFNVPIQQ